MDISFIIENLNRIYDENAKLKFLEKCLFGESSNTTKIKILELMREIKKNQRSFEEYLKKLVKDKKVQIIAENLKKSSGHKVNDRKKPEPIILESVIESELQRNKLIETLSPTLVIPAKTAESRVYATKLEEPIKIGEYKQKIENTYIPKEQAETATYRPKIDAQEGYKRMEALIKNEGEQEKIREYKRKLLKGEI